MHTYTLIAHNSTKLKNYQLSSPTNFKKIIELQSLHSGSGEQYQSDRNQICEQKCESSGAKKNGTKESRS